MFSTRNPPHISHQQGERRSANFVARKCQAAMDVSLFFNVHVASSKQLEQSLVDQSFNRDISYNQILNGLI